MEIKTAERLRELRETTGRKQQDVVDELGKLTGEVISRQNVSKYESGKVNPPPEMLIAFSKMYHVTTDYLLGASDNKNPYAAEAAAYTGLSPEALRVLHDISAVGQRTTSTLNKIILHRDFCALLVSMGLLEHRASEIEKVKIRNSMEPDSMVMQTKRDQSLYNTVNKEYGLAVILKGIDAIRYEAVRIGNNFQNIVFGVCGIGKAEVKWQEMCRKAIERGEHDEKESK